MALVHDQTKKTETTDHLAGMLNHIYDMTWVDYAFASKKPIRDLHATFVAAPRQLSETRIKQLIKAYLPNGNLIFGIANEAHIDGFGHNPGFRTLQRADLQAIMLKVNASSPSHKVYTLHYSQSDLQYILDKIKFRQVLLVRGSWHTVFHTSPAFYALAKQGIPFEYISPFADETEAQAYAKTIEPQITKTYPMPDAEESFPPEIYQTLTEFAAAHSLDYTFQTGAVLAKRSDKRYKLLAWSYNQVVPYQTYAMHHGNSREVNFSPPGDLNHYDSVHAEMNLLITAAKQGISLKDTTMFVNLMPCPTCARALSQTDIAEFVYAVDRSADYAISLLSAAGKAVHRA